MFLKLERIAIKEKSVQQLKNCLVLPLKAVTTSNVKGKKKIYRGKAGQRVNWKKAVVRVSEGQMIDATAS